MSLEALLANMKPYDIAAPRAARVQGRRAQRRPTSAQSSRARDLVTGKLKAKVQDAYSMRSTPQVIGAAHDAFAYARTQVEIELNGVGDNPIFLPEINIALTGANFQGTPVLMPLDMAGRGHHHGLRALRAAPEPPHQPRPQRRPPRLPHQGRGDVLAA